MQKLRGASLAKVLHVLQLIHEEKQRRKSEFPRIVVNFVVQSDNVRELPELVRLLSPLGIFFLGVNPLHHFFGVPGPYGSTITRSSGSEKCRARNSRRPSSTSRGARQKRPG